MLRAASNRFKRFGMVFLSLVLMGAIFGIFALPTAHAYTGNLLIQNGAASAACGSVFTPIIAPSTVVSGDGMVMTIFDIGAGVHVLSITDNLGNAWISGLTQFFNAVNNEVWYVSSGVGGSLTTFTVTFSASVSNCGVMITQYDTGAIVATQGTASGGGISGLNYPTSTCNTGTAAICNIKAGGVGIVKTAPSLVVESVTSNIAPGAGSTNLVIACTAIMPGATGPCTNPSSLIQVGGSTPTVFGVVSNPGQVTTAYQFTQPGQPASTTVPSAVFVVQTSFSAFPSAAINFFAMRFSLSGVFYKYTAAVESIGCGGFNATSTTITSGAVYYIEGQADPFGISIANASAILDSVTVAPVTLQMAIYTSQVANNSVPSSVNPFVLVGTAASLNLPITSTKQVISFTPNVAIVGFHFYLIAIAQTAAGSGVTKLRISTTPILVYSQPTVAIGQLPPSIIAGQIPTTNHNPCIFGFNLNTPAQVTLVSGGANTTVITSTITSLDSNAAVTGSVNFSILLLLLMGPCILFAAIFGGITKSGTAALGGGAIGLGMGAAIGNVAGFVPLWLVGVMVVFCVVLGILAMFSNRGG